MTAPEWADPDPCPADGCDGEWWTDVGGSAASPTTEYRTTCGHSLESCANCGDKFDRGALTTHSWLNSTARGGIGEWVFVHLCEDCNTEETVEALIPEWVRKRDGIRGVLDG